MMTFDIAAQPLGAALNEFAQVTGWQVSATTDVTGDVRTSGIVGHYTPEHALAALLAGTGLQYRLSGERAVTLTRSPFPPAADAGVSPAAPAAPPDGIVTPHPEKKGQRLVKVPEIMVKEARERKEPSYTADESTSAMRIPVPVHDTPRAVEIVTRQVLDDQKIIRFGEALRNVSGVSQFSTAGGQGGEVMIRGFVAKDGLNIFKNGFRDDSVFSSRTQRDVIDLERIEVVKAPPSYLYGRADPGGVINQISKSPLKNPYYSAELIVGSYGLYRPQIDIGGPLNDNKTVTYRFNAMYESAGSYRDGVQSTRTFLAPTIGWDIGPRTSVRVDGEYLFDRSPIDRGLVAFGGGVAPIPVSRFLGDPDRKNEIHQGKATLTLWHRFSDLFQWRTAFRAAASRQRYSSLESNAFVGDESGGILNLARYEIPSTAQSHYLQNELHGTFLAGAVKHKTILGVELGRETFSNQVSGDFGGDTTTPGAFSFINIFNPNDRLFLNNALTRFSDTTTRNGVLGVYAGDQVDVLENLHMHVGGRFDVFEQRVTTRPDDLTAVGNSTKDSENAFSPSVGLAYQPWKPITLYANYTESFAPQAAGSRSFAGTPFKAERGKSYEGGFKYQAPDGRVRANVALFDTTKRNVLTGDPANGFLFSVSTGEQRSKGVEFDIAGKILPGWDVIANYAYIDARVTEDNRFLVGSRAPNTALHQGSLWTTYFFQEGIAQGFGAGIGLYAQGKRNGLFQCQDPTNCQAPFELPGYVRMDAALYYRKQGIFERTNLLAAINFTNLLDHRYFTGTQNFREIIYTGAPFTVIGSVKLEFN
ncbi:MAG: TonB-dependent receptor [Nitrospiraceae bacterium]